MAREQDGKRAKCQDDKKEKIERRQEGKKAR